MEKVTVKQVYMDSQANIYLPTNMGNYMSRSYFKLYYVRPGTG